MTREGFLSRVSQSRRGLAEVSAPTGEELAIARRVTAGADRVTLVQRFAERVQAVGMVPHLAPADKLAEVLSQILGERGYKNVWLTRQPPLDSPELIKCLQAGSNRCINHWPEGTCAFEIEAAVSVAVGGVAETGSLLVESGPQTPRQATLVPPGALVLVPGEIIVPDLADALAAIPGRLAKRPHANFTLITGPSKTSDIEKTLVTGVHGPGCMDVVIVT